ncbi:nucleoside-diphosphate kinase [Streptomyces sp. 4N124]|uniref:nucleoside-diphosphate kinase n=1 Tax=Streptomyces sp. 4N124 TaxID=3457420 RepID=UPI003FD1D728
MNRGEVIPGVDFSRRAVILCKPDCVERGLVDEVLDRIAATGVTVSGRRDMVAQPWQAHVAYRDMLADTRMPALDIPACLDATYAGRPVTVALAHGEPGVHRRLRHLLGHTDPTRSPLGTIRGDLADDSLAAARAERRLVRNLVHTSDDAEAARRDFGTWYRTTHHGAHALDFHRSVVILCKPDCVERGLVDEVLNRIAAAGAMVSDRLELTAQAWQAHVHYWDLLVDADSFPDRDVPACLDATYAGRPVTVALAHGEPGLHDRLRHLLGYFDPTQAAPGTIRGDLGDDSLKDALAEQRLVHNLVHTSDDADAARRDFGTWYGAGRRVLLTSPSHVPHQPAPANR